MIEPKFFGDMRGFFMETYNKKEFNDLGFKTEFVQDNHSRSTKGILRGLHFQRIKPQGKIVRVIKGRIFDVIVDLRRTSPTYGHYLSFELTDENRKMLFIPKECAHGFLSLTEEVEVIYKVTDYYYPEYEAGIIWNDPTVNIQWPLKDYNIKEPVLSTKDSNLPRFENIENEFFL